MDGPIQSTEFCFVLRSWSIVSPLKIMSEQSGFVYHVSYYNISIGPL
jgi:hypothetical protein